MGDVRVEGWVPMRLIVDAAVDDAGAETLSASLAPCPVEVVENYGREAREIPGRGRTRRVTKRIRLQYAPHDDRQAVYAESLRALLADQIAWVRDRGHRRRTTEDNGLKALVCAEAAAKLAGRASDDPIKNRRPAAPDQRETP